MSEENEVVDDDVTPEEPVIKEKPSNKKELHRTAISLHDRIMEGKHLKAELGL